MANASAQSLLRNKALILVPALLGTCAPICSYGQQLANVRTYKMEGERRELFSWGGLFNQPIWSGGALIGVTENDTDSPTLYRIDVNGIREQTRFAIPGFRLITIYGLAGAPDNSIVTIGSAHSEDGKISIFLARTTNGHQGIAVTRLLGYMPFVVAVGPDNTIWTEGYTRFDEFKEDQPNVLKHFDSKGNELRSWPLRVKSKLGWASNAGNWSQVVALQDRLCWLTNAGEYLEISLDGKINQVIPGPPGVQLMTMAVSENNEVVVSATTNEPKWAGAWQLNRAASQWEPIRLDGTTHAILGGFDKDQLVSIGTDGVVRHFSISNRSEPFVTPSRLLH